MRIIFFKTMPLDYYQGMEHEHTRPHNGGKYVKEHGDGHETYNFESVPFDDGKEYCLGFVEAKSTNGKDINQLHIERLGEGVGKYDHEAEDVLVVWCTTPEEERNKPVVVGWYKHATVYRRYEDFEFDNGYIQSYSCIAEVTDCVLLPTAERHDKKWRAPVAKKQGYGFGQSLVWYADKGTEDEAKYIDALVKNISEYTGENWIDKFK